MTSENNQNPAKKRKIRTFRDEWLVEFNWLMFDKDKQAMFCTLCLKHKKVNAFTSSSGSQDFQKSALTRHMTGKFGHKEAFDASKQQVLFKKAVTTAQSQSSDGLIAQMRTVMFLVQEGMALDKFSKLMELQKTNGAQISGQYTHHQQVEQMLTVISDSLLSDMKQAIAASDFVGIICDESCDIAVFKKLCIYLRVVVDGKIKIFYAQNKDVVDGKADTIVAAITTLLADLGLPVHKVVGLGSDGAAVMMGARNGVGVQLKRNFPLLVHVHCTAHLLALAVSQGANEVPMLKKYQETVNGIFHYFNNSAVRYNRLHAVHEVLENTPVALKQPHAVRWLSLDQSVQAILRSWPALVTTFGEEAAGGNAAARGFLLKIDCFSFIGLTCLLADILPMFSKLSKIFQSDDLEFERFSTQLTTTKQSIQAMITDEDHISLPTLHGLLNCNEPADGEDMITYKEVPVKKTDHGANQLVNQKSLFLNELMGQLDRRFPEDGMTVLSNLNKILNPKVIKGLAQQAVAGHCVAELREVVALFDAHPQVGVDGGRAMTDFLQYKQHARQSTATTLPAFGEELIMEFNDLYPDYAILMKFLLTIPLNSVPCERGFSVQNFQKTKLRNRLCDQRLNEIMRVSINGPHFANFDYTHAAVNFRQLKERRK